jgi:hypothetical protein
MQMSSVIGDSNSGRNHDRHSDNAMLQFLLYRLMLWHLGGNVLGSQRYRSGHTGTTDCFSYIVIALGINPKRFKVALCESFLFCVQERRPRLVGSGPTSLCRTGLAPLCKSEPTPLCTSEPAPLSTRS